MESFHVVLLKDASQAGAGLVLLKKMLVLLKYKSAFSQTAKLRGSCPFNSVLCERTVIIDEDTIARYGLF